MTDTDTFEQEATDRTDSRQFRAGSVFLTAVLLLAGFSGGIYWERSGYSLDSFWGLARGEGMSKHGQEIDVLNGPSDPGALEARLTEQIRSMHSEIARLGEQAKEGRIHYNLLLQRGYSKDDGVCISLVASQNKIKERVKELKDSAREAEALRQRLIATIKDLAQTGQSDGMDESLRADVLRLIHRAGLQDTTRTVIPDAVWIEPRASEGMGRINGD